jgi:hypothetical protein
MGGLLNRNAVHAAADRLLQSSGGVAATSAQRQAAARRLVDLFATIGDVPPHSLTTLAGAGIGQPPPTGSWDALEPW